MIWSYWVLTPQRTCIIATHDGFETNANKTHLIETAVAAGELGKDSCSSIYPVLFGNDRLLHLSSDGSEV